MANEIRKVEYKDGVITDNCLIVIGQKKTAAISIKVEFADGSTMGGRLFLTESSAKRTVETLRKIGWQGMSFAELYSPVLKGLKVNCTIGDCEDKDGNVICSNDGKPYREIKFFNTPANERLTEAEAANIASHFDYLLGVGVSSNTIGVDSNFSTNTGFSPDDHLAF